MTKNGLAIEIDPDPAPRLPYRRPLERVVLDADADKVATVRFCGELKMWALRINQKRRETRKAEK